MGHFHLENLSELLSYPGWAKDIADLSCASGEPADEKTWGKRIQAWRKLGVECRAVVHGNKIRVLVVTKPKQTDVQNELDQEPVICQLHETGYEKWTEGCLKELLAPPSPQPNLSVST